ncbi:DitF protein [Tardibacter chloracetimidivorans]|uniref:DitF protein n=1 Tax=Tardibacter chloracetimidivorans TaxID=1921510 RepID=A0A1L3ZW98_9SPHN|nr:DitF protein [Tardibacter chloracetimidivorans]API59906.1 DitF protein [Tardibacter chloracetimidivorans]
MKYGEKQAIISGIGQSRIGRRLDVPGLTLTVDAIERALDDAGLAASDIDGMTSWPGFMPDSPGFSPVSIGEVKEAFGFDLNYYSAGPEASQLSAIINACMAVATGQARHVVCFRTMTESSAMAKGERSSVIGQRTARVDGLFQWLSPFGAVSASNWVGMIAQRYLHEFGKTRADLAPIALNARANAARNPAAIYREALSLDDYMAARMISAPLCLYDCDVPIDGSTVLIISHRDTAPDLRSKAIRIEAACGTLIGRDSWDQQPDPTRFMASAAAERMWSRTDLKPNDVDVACLYDGFSFLTVLWIEALGYCGRGEALDFIAGGHRIAPDGELPLNPHGGQLSAGRTHGFGFVHEAVTQLRGGAGERQIGGDPSTAVITNGGGNIASALLLVRD